MLISISSRAQIPSRDLSTKAFVRSIFHRILEQGMDTTKSIKWTYEFADQDSLLLSTVMTHFVKKQKDSKINDIILGTIKDNNPRRKLEGSYIIEIEQSSILTQNDLLKKIKGFQKTFKKTPIEFVGAGFYAEVSESSLNTTPLLKEASLNVNTKTFKGQVSDSKTNAKIPFVSIGIIDADIGTVSDEEGNYSLEIPKKCAKDTLTISCIGYETQHIPILTIGNKEKIQLNPTSKVLNEVLVESTSFSKKIDLGIQKTSGHQFGFVNGKGAGAEAARLMKLKKDTKIFLNEVAVFVDSDSPIEFLVNIYEQDNITGLPGNIIMTKTLHVTSKSMKGWFVANLNNQQIIIDHSFFVSFQWVNDIVNEPVIAIKGNSGYQRAISMGKWVESSTFSWVIKATGTILE